MTDGTRMTKSFPVLLLLYIITTNTGTPNEPLIHNAVRSTTSCSSPRKSCYERIIVLGKTGSHDVHTTYSNSQAISIP